MKNNFCLIVAFCMATSFTLLAQQYDSPLGVFQSNSDIGNVKLQGKTVYDSDKQIYTIEGAGTNIWFDRDEFQYAWKKIKGDFILTAQVEFIGKGVNPHRKLGWMVRQSLNASSPHVSATIHGDGLTSLQYRAIAGDNMSEKKLGIQSPNIVQLCRNGNIYTMSVAQLGDTFVSEQVAVCGIPDEAYVGLFVCSHDPDVKEKAIFKNVRIEIPATDSMVMYRDFLGSNLETLDVFSGERHILKQFPNSIQAPNWTPDNQSLIYNSEGLLYRFDLASAKIDLLNTGHANGINNDHVLTFDGRYIGISSNHDPVDKGQSAVYYLPVTGGEPMKVTQNTPSYFHGWSPDGKEMAFIGQRNGNFDVYKIAREGGKEIRLTTAEGLDDGSEYTPDGNYIYFNSVRTGNMQIWRMKSDGSEQEQVTHDSLNNWFPHISPDGKWIVFITFGNDVDPSDHPFYKHVYLQIMPISGGKPKVIAYLYGGQGTMNVPSWAPDSRKIAFVSNSGGLK